VTAKYPDGHVVITGPDGRVTWGIPSKGHITLFPCGRTIETRPDGSRIITERNGTETTIRPDGTTFTTWPDGTHHRHSAEHANAGGEQPATPPP